MDDEVMINTYPASQSEAVVDLNKEINKEAGTAMQVNSVAADSAAPTSEPIGEGAFELVSVAAHSAAPIMELGSFQLDSVAADSAAPNAELPIEDIARSSFSAISSSSETNSSTGFGQRGQSLRSLSRRASTNCTYQDSSRWFLPLPDRRVSPICYGLSRWPGRSSALRYYPRHQVFQSPFGRPRSPSPCCCSPSPSKRDDSSRFTCQSLPRYGPNMQSRSPQNTNLLCNFLMRDTIIHPVENILRERLFNMNPASSRTQPPPLAPRAMQTQSASKTNNSTTVKSRPVQIDILNIASDVTQVEPPNLLNSAYARISPLPTETTIDYALCLLIALARTSTEGFSIQQMFLRTTSNGNRELWV